MPEMGPAIFVDAEDDAAVMHRRLAAITRHYGVTFADLIKGGLHLISLMGQDAVLATAGRGGKLEPTARYRQILDMVADVKPVMIGLASSANFFDRAQVQQFISLMTRLAMTANGSVVLISHPSLSGIQSDSGLSGSSQWHNSVRARYYMKALKPEDGEPDNDLRELTFRKNNYGPISESIPLRYQDGLFLKMPGVSSLERAHRDTEADAMVFDQLRKDQMNVSNNPHAGNYAPRVFAKMLKAKQHGLTTKDLEGAVQRLEAAGKIRVERYGRPSDPRFRLVVNKLPAERRG